MTTRSFLRQLRRDARGNRAQLLFFVACLAVGVAAVVAVAGFSEGFDRAIRAKGRDMLAADVAIRGRRPITPELLGAIDSVDGTQRAQVREMLTLAATEGTETEPATSRLVELKAVDDLYPFYGELKTDPSEPLAELFAADEQGRKGVLVDPAILSQLELGLGDPLRIGEAEFHIAGTVISEPDGMATAFRLGPRVMISSAGLDQAALIQTGSRVNYRTLVRLPDHLLTQTESIRTDWEQHIDVDRRHRIETFREGQPELRRGLRRMDRYLGLAALLSLLLGGVGVTQTVRAWTASRLDATAVRKCLGWRPREVLLLDLAQITLLALAGSAIGVVLGIAAQQVPLRLVGPLILPGVELPLWQPFAVLRGFALGLGVAWIAALPTLLTARRVPPIRVLRRDAEPIPPSRFVQATTGLCVLLGVWALASWQAMSWKLGGGLTLALTAVAALLVVAAKGLTVAAARPRRKAKLWLRQGMAGLARPGAGTVAACAALGMGVLVTALMAVVQHQVGDSLRREFPENAPTAFMVDIQPDQWDGVQALLQREDVTRIDSVPVVMARLREINQVGVQEYAEERGPGERDWVFRREQRLTWLDELPEGNVIVEGALWDLDDDVAEVSLEQDFAGDLGVGLGDVLRFEIQGVPIEVTVTSIRTVDWETFGINFFLVVEPGFLENAPYSRIAAARLPDDREQAVQDALVAEFPNVTLIRTREVLERVASILGQLGIGVRFLGLFTVLAGLVILAGAASVSALQRGKEVALLKTLGMTRRQVLLVFAVEYVMVGLVAGAIGLFGASAIGWWVLTRVLDTVWVPDVLRLTATLAATILLASGAGLAASRGALKKRPIEVLRGG